MPRYELSEGTSNKFWEIALDGASFTTTYGKIGTSGQSTVKTFASEAQAKKEYDKLIAEKVKKGYQPAGGNGATNGQAAAAPAKPAKAAKAAAPAKAAKAATPAKAADGKASSASSASGKPGARYFELVDGSSSKFWEVALEDTSVTTRYGRIGSAGQETVKDFDSKAEAFKEYDKLVTEKTKKGYREIAPAGAPQSNAGNPELEAAIDANPRDEAAYSVYADWLQGEGDPRGELIALQLAGKDAQAKALIDKQADYFLGPLADHQKTYDGSDVDAFTWKYGFIHALRLSHDHYADEEFDGSLAEVFDLVLRHPSGRFLTEITFVFNNDPNENDLQDLIDLLARKAPPTIRKLHFGDYEYCGPSDDTATGNTEISWYSIGNLGKLWKAVPRLEKLITQGGSGESAMAGGMKLGTIDLPELVHAEFRTGGLEKANARAIATGKFPKLEHLDIWYGDDNYGGDATAKDVQPLLDRTDLPKLRHLGLKNAKFTDELPPLLARSRLVGQLAELDLSMGCLTDEGAAGLVQHRDAFAHLEVLDVSENYLSNEALATLQGIAKRVVSTEQRDLDEPDDPDARYPAVAE